MQVLVREHRVDSWIHYKKCKFRYYSYLDLNRNNTQRQKVRLGRPPNPFVTGKIECTRDTTQFVAFLAQIVDEQINMLLFHLSFRHSPVAKVYLGPVYPES